MENLYLIVWLHFIADSVFQSCYIPGKKENKKALAWLHCLVYTFFWLAFPIKFILFIGLSHCLVDFFTVRLGDELWEEGKVYKFFVLLGFDQALHLSLLFWANTYLG